MSIRRHKPSVDVPSFSDAPALDATISACLDDPLPVISELQDDQRRIADELESTFLAYDRKLQSAAKRLVSLGLGHVTAEELERLRTEQLELWRLIRRAQVAQRSTRALAREVHEWRAHGPTAVPEGHPDHPETRVEIVESELRVRGVRETGEATPATTVASGPIEIPMDVEIADEAAVVGSIAAPEWESDIDDEHLLREIHGHERELARTTQPADVADLMRSLRTLHGYLRLHDRQRGRPRVRWQLGLGRQITG